MKSQSGLFACIINMSQFFIIAQTGPVSSTVVGHVKTCSIVALGWMTSGRAVGDKSIIGVLVAIGGIMGYVYHEFLVIYFLFIHDKHRRNPAIGQGSPKALMLPGVKRWNGMAKLHHGPRRVWIVSTAITRQAELCSPVKHCILSRRYKIPCTPMILSRLDMNICHHSRGFVFMDIMANNTTQILCSHA